MIEIEPEEFWAVKLITSTPTRPTWIMAIGPNSRETTMGSGCRQITSPANTYLPNFTDVLEETRF